MRIGALGLTFACSLALSAPVAGQPIDGYVSVMFDAFPNVDTSEIRSRLLAEYERDVGDRLHITATGFVDGLLRHREGLGLTGFGLVEPQELSLELRWPHADLRVGLSRVVWGRLDEFQPTDVVNPLDLTRFFLEGRSEARLPVAMIRARWLPSDRFTLESIYVPFFRRGRFDQLDEPTAPLNPAPSRSSGTSPPATLENAQGGVRLTTTTGRVDWSIDAYRGFESLPLYDGPLGRFPRFTMIGGDFETVKGMWGVRGEIAVFVERTFQGDDLVATVAGRDVQAGVGVDRKAGDYRVSGNVLFARRFLTSFDLDRRDVTLVAAVDRSFARETRALRVFGVYNPAAGTAFGRVVGTISLRDNLSLEGSVGIFAGATGTDLFSVYADRDFGYGRFKVFF